MSPLRTRGHDAAVATVARAVRTERPPHAVLLVGPAGVGKSTLAGDLAAGLLCLAAPAERPCGACLACRKVAHRTHPDVHRLAPEGAGGQVRLGQVHELQRDLALLPLEGRFRIAIVEQAHRMNPDAQNAFLKTLEEPPARVCLVLAADDESMLLPTVRSRCARIVLSPVGRTAVAALLVERGLADPARAATIARTAGGRPGVAMALASRPEALLVRRRILGTLLDLARADRHTRLAAAHALLADAAALAEALEAPGDPLPAADGDARETAAESVPQALVSERSRKGMTPAETGSAPVPTRRPVPAPAERRRAVMMLIQCWRQVARDVAIAAQGGTAEISDVEALEDVLALASDLHGSDLAAFLARLDEVDSALEAYANPELVLDVLLVRWPRPRAAA